jgi:hypothetical protein
VSTAKDAVAAAVAVELDLERRYTDVIERGTKLHRSLGLHPWDPELDDPEFSAELVPGVTPAQLAPIIAEAKRLEAQRLKLSAALDRARERRIELERTASRNVVPLRRD